MRIPRLFTLGGTTWQVVQIKDLAELGRCQRDIHTIQLKQNIPKAIKEQTFCHELVHAIKYTLGEAEDHDEQKVDVFATFLHQFMTTVKYR